MPDSIDVHNQLISQRQYDEAELFARECLAAEPERLAGYTQLAIALAAQCRIDEAEAAARTAVGKAPQNAWANAVLACTLDRPGRYADAEGAAREAIRLDPRCVLAHETLSAATLHLRRPDESRAAAVEGLRLEPENEYLTDCHGWAEMARGRPAEAARIADAGLARFPDCASLWNLRGSIRSVYCEWSARRGLLGGHREIDHAFGQAVRLEPGEAKYRSNLLRNAELWRSRAVVVAATGVAAVTAALGVGAALTCGAPAERAEVAIRFALLASLPLPFCTQGLPALAAPLSRLGVPPFPLGRAERRRGRLVLLAAGLWWLAGFALMLAWAVRP